YLENGQTRQALEPLQRSAELAADRSDIALALATAYDQLAQSQEALSHARQALTGGLADQEQVTNAQFIAGRALYRIGDYRAASDLLRLVLQARPTGPLSQMWAGLAAYQLADYATAVGNFERAVQLNPNSVEARANLGAGYLAAQRYQEAETVYALLVSQNDSDFE